MLSNTDAASKNEILIGYSPNDFFYSSVYNGGIPTDVSCNQLNPYESQWDIKCNTSHFMDNSNNCISQQLCINKDRVKKMQNILNKQTGSDERFDNAKSVYNYTLVNILNLGVGIMVMIGLIYKYRKPST